MNDIARVGRAAARRLAAQGGPDLRLDVDRVLATIVFAESNIPTG